MGSRRAPRGAARAIDDLGKQSGARNAAAADAQAICATYGFVPASAAELELEPLVAAK